MFQRVVADLYKIIDPADALYGRQPRLVHLVQYSMNF